MSAGVTLVKGDLPGIARAAGAREVLAGVYQLGIVLDANANRAAVGAEALISRSDGEVEVWVIPVDEARILAEEAVAVVRPPAAMSSKKEKS